MLFMVIERFKPGATSQIGERFSKHGRMLPEGLRYLVSWVDPAGARCFQVMEADQPQLLGEWMRHWDDLVQFEVIPVVASVDFWANRQRA